MFPINRQAMISAMFGSRHQFKIFHRIVQCVMVFMVNIFRPFKLPFNFLFHQESVLVFPFPIGFYLNDPINPTPSIMLSSRSNRPFNNIGFSNAFNHFCNTFFRPGIFGRDSRSVFNLPNHCLSLFFNGFLTSFMSRTERCLIGASHSEYICHSGG